MKEVYSVLFPDKVSTYHCRILTCQGELPTPRSGHSGVLVGNNVFVFGGYDNGICYTDLFRNEYKYYEMG